jgi:exodeoxyribonuclease-1
MIYSGGFFTPADRRLMETVRNTKPRALAQQNWPFKDPRLAEMLFRYRARNYPDSLSDDEFELWQQQRLRRLENPSDERQLNTERYKQELASARESRQGDNHAQKILDHLEAWGDQLIMPNNL